LDFANVTDHLLPVHISCTLNPSNRAAVIGNLAVELLKILVQVAGNLHVLHTVISYHCARLSNKLVILFDPFIPFTGNIAASNEVIS